MKSKVTVLKTSPQTVLEDYGKLMRMAGYEAFLPKDKQTFLKINLSWREWYPAASTEPWQLEGVIKTLIEDGYEPASITALSNHGMGSQARDAEILNGLTAGASRQGLEIARLDEHAVSWIPFTPEAELVVLDRLTGEDDIRVPEALLGNNIIHLPTIKTHTLSVIAGSAMSWFDTLLTGQWEKADIHAVLADLLAVQQELCGGVFTVTDGTISGDGPGPRTLIPYKKDYILAGPDPVAVDSVAARMMGFDPMQIGYIRMATERGIGNGEAGEIEIAGDDVSGVDFHFHGGKRPRIPKTDAVLQYYWYPFRGWPHVGRMAETEWGQLFQEYLPEGAELDRQGKGKGPVLALAAAAALLSFSAAKRVARMARRGA